LLGRNRKLEPDLKGKRIYDEAVRKVIILLWKSTDRICGKRLKANIPALITSMENNEHLTLDEELRDLALKVSAATIDRLLAPVREGTTERRKRRKKAKSLVKKKVKIRTFDDWDDPQAGFFEADFVAHCGGAMAGRFIHTFTMTDIASGWTECIPLINRNQSLVIKALDRFRASLPMTLLGFDTDNDSVFINNTVIDYCAENSIIFTRSRPYKKNDQAWVEQKNGSVVRRLVGYDRYQGPKACQTLARLFRSSRLHVNFFQPSKLREKLREGAVVRKYYHAPATPCDRLLNNAHVPKKCKQALLDLRATLDPIKLLQNIREAQNDLAYIINQKNSNDSLENGDLGAFLSQLSRLWKTGTEPRATHRKKKQKSRRKSSRIDLFTELWPETLQKLEQDPEAHAKELFISLQERYPGKFKAGPLRTFQRRVRDWRCKSAESLLRYSLGDDLLGDSVPQTPRDLSHCGKPVHSIEFDKINNACSEVGVLLGSNPRTVVGESTVEG
jgi:hypothetical protein